MVNLTNSLFDAIRDNGAQWLLHASNIFDSLGFTGTRRLDTACSALENLMLMQNATILDATYYGGGLTGAPINVAPTCEIPIFNLGTEDLTVPLCRIRFEIATSETSVVSAEAWLPDDWNGRFLAVGNGGLGGCIDYRSLSYGASLGFSVVGSNNGHDGGRGDAFFNKPEVIEDFAHRAMHFQTIAGKEITRTFYGQSHNKSFYLGCSTGGRQGFMSALRYPEDFDGIVAGAPAVNFNMLTGFVGMLSRHVGAPNAVAESNPSYIPRELWKTVSAEILRQCDEIDGVKDGLLAEPDLCDFRPDELHCSKLQQKSEAGCLTTAQVEALKKIYSPLYGSHGQVLFPRYDPGAESGMISFSSLFKGEMFAITNDWFKYVIYNDTNYDFRNFGVKDIELAAEMDPAGISTFSGDMSAFQARGGKFLTFHGRKDELIPSGISKIMYELVSETLGLPSLDDFYRLFLVPGLDHCFWGPGAVNFGQHDNSKGPEATRNLTSHNILLALVEWVEMGKAPDEIIGSSAVGDERKHCRYPWRSVWDDHKSSFECVL